MEIMNEILIRLKDIDKENSLLATLYTTSPSEYLKMYYFCQKNSIPLSISSEKIGCIEDIDVIFGGGDNIPCIDVWIKK